MSDKIIAIISSSDSEKARIGLAFAMNALKNDWLADVKIFVFGPAEALLSKDADIQGILKEVFLMECKVVACKAVADRYGISEEISALGVTVEYVGKMISDLTKDGYLPMVW